ncbi:MAG: hypothetical protein KBS59_00975 [Clostridiales bacterium]|nr:hypothetical protein [Clostridiales bacterium]
MKNGFFAENSKYIWKLVRTHLVMAIFGLMVFIPFNLDKAAMNYFMLFGSAAGIILYMFLIDVDMWYLGAEDRIRTDAGRQKKCAFKGFLIGLCAEIPSIVLGIAYAVISVLYSYYQSYPSGQAYGAAKVVSYLACFLWNGVYLGVEKTLGGATVPLYHLLSPLLPVLFAGLTYALGYSGSNFLKPPSKEKKQK